MHRYPLLSKSIVVGVLALLLIIPIGMIHSLLGERMELKAQVERDIANSSFGAQKVIAPVLVVPYKFRVTKTEWQDGKQVVKQEWQDRRLHFLAREVDVNGSLTTDTRYRGLYKTQLYSASIQLSGNFDLPKHYGVSATSADYQWGNPYLSLGVSDTRGIKTVNLEWNDSARGFQPGAGLSFWANGIRAELPNLFNDAHTRLPFSIALQLNGSALLEWVPLGEEVRVHLRSAWPHPGFHGQFLPDQRQVSDAGFDAQWRITHFATNAHEKLDACLRESGSCGNLLGTALAVSLIEPVDVYRQVDRALKYPLLFICLTFAAVFLLELFKRLAIHPVQYALVGMALALFFLILLTLSEHLSFALAYLCATLVCVGLLGIYTRHVLKSAARGLAFALGLAILYGALYLVLLSEDHSLLIGTALLFSALASVMLITRKVDWYELSARLVGSRSNGGTAPLADNRQ